MPPRHLDAAQVLQQLSAERRTCRITGRPNVARQLQLRRVEALLPRAVQARHEVVEADLADRHQARVGAAAVERVAQALQVVVRRAARRTSGWMPSA